MPLSSAIENTGASYTADIRYSAKGYWRVGGLISHHAEVHTIDQLRSLIQLGEPLHILGNGSNMLMSDLGVCGVAVSLKGSFLEWSLSEDSQSIWVGAGLRNTVLLNGLKKATLGGLAALAGVPGTIGGAIRMNAGTALGEIGDSVLAVEWIDRETGQLHQYDKATCGFQYRKATGLPWSAIVTRVHFTVSPRSEEMQNKVRHHLQRRKETQPLHLPSCGSVFTNPAGDYAGRLIESVGLKGRQIGQAQISDKHANFIVNLGGASAMDVYQLMRLAKSTVHRETGVTLHPEVKPIGQWSEGLWPL